MDAYIPFYDRGNIRPADLAELRRHALELSKALARIEVLALEEVEGEMVTSKSSIWEIERIAREAISE